MPQQAFLLSNLILYLLNQSYGFAVLLLVSGFEPPFFSFHVGYLVLLLVLLGDLVADIQRGHYLGWSTQPGAHVTTHTILQVLLCDHGLEGLDVTLDITHLGPIVVSDHVIVSSL